MTMSLGLECPLEVKGGAAACATRVGRSSQLPAGSVAALLTVLPGSHGPRWWGQGLCVHPCWVTVETPGHKTSLLCQTPAGPRAGERPDEGRGLGPVCMWVTQRFP